MERTLTIEGFGKTLVKPDQLIISIRISAVGITYGEAVEALDTSTTHLISLFEHASFNADFIEQSGLKLELGDDLDMEVLNDYFEEAGLDTIDEEEFPKYSVSRLLTYVDDLDEVHLETFMELIADEDIDDLDVSYGVSDYETIKNDTLVKAIEDAKSKASIIAKASDVKLHEIQSIDYMDYDEDIEYLDQIYFEFEMGHEVTQRISLTWNIK